MDIQKSPCIFCLHLPYFLFSLKGTELLDWADEEAGWDEEANQDLDVDKAIKEQKERMRELKKKERLKKKAEMDYYKNMNKICGNQKIAMKLS